MVSAAKDKDFLDSSDSKKLKGVLNQRDVDQWQQALQTRRQRREKKGKKEERKRKREEREEEEEKKRKRRGKRKEKEVSDLHKPTKAREDFTLPLVSRA